MIIPDDAAEQAARGWLEEDAKGFSCSLANAQVSRLDDMTIVRMDLRRGEAAIRLPGIWRLPLIVTRA